MGLFNRIKDPVEGTAQVAAATAHAGNGTHQTVRMNLVVQALGVEPFTLEHKCIAHHEKWPHPGDTLPVVFDRSRPDRLKVDWDKVPNSRDVARQQAEAMRDALAGGGPAAVGIPPEAADIVSQLQQAFPGAQVQVQPEVQVEQQHQVIDLRNDPNRDAVLGALESAMGQDLDGDGKIGGAAAAAPDGDDDRLAQLERLAKLRDSGALTEEEFAAEKQRLLGGG